MYPKREILKRNNKSFKTEEIHKKTMIKLNLKTKFNKNGKHEILSKRKKQRNNYILKQKKITLIR